MKIEAILFDVGVVLIGLDFNRLFNRLQITQSSGAEEAINRMNTWETYDRFERGQVTAKEFHAWLLEKTKHTLGETDFWDAWNSILLDPVDGVPEILATLSKKYPLYALTNANEVHFNHVMKKYPMLTHFQAVFSSHQLGYRKPDAEIYRLVLQRIGRSADSVLFIDDREENVEGARRIGLVAEVCKNPPADLLKILHKFNILSA